MQGICLRAYPTPAQKAILSRWMGCARTIWNAKCDDNRYLTTFARKYCPINTYPPIDKTYAQYKNREETPWLFECPSQVLRNTATVWCETYQNFMKGRCGKPKRKKKSDKGSLWLTSELFKFEEQKDGTLRLVIGTTKYPVGVLSLKKHRLFKIPRSLRIRKELGEYFVSFCYEEEKACPDVSAPEQLRFLQEQSRAYLEAHTVGVDRGVVIAAQTSDTSYELTPQQLARKKRTEDYLKRYQRRLAKQEKGSNRRAQTKYKIGRCHQKISNIRQNFCHQTSHAIVNEPQTQIIVLEDLKTTNLTKSAQGDRENRGKNVKAKAGLNRAILDKGWHQLETFLVYKAKRSGKYVFKVSAAYTSQECADCGHIHPNNRVTQSEFRCVHCGHTDHADKNAAKVIKKRAINLILDSGTELSAKGVLVPPKLLADRGRGDRSKTRLGKVQGAAIDEPSKKKIKQDQFIDVA